MIDNEIALWNNFLAGDITSFEKIVSCFYKSLYNYGRQFTLDNDLIKDTIQDLFFHIWKNRQTLNSTNSVKFYLLKSFRRKLLRKLIQETRVGVDEINLNDIESSELFNPIFEPVSFKEQDIIATETIKELALYLREIIAKLSKRQQEIIYLKFFDEADVNEIAEVMNISKQSVYNLLHEALKNLKILSSERNILKSVQLLSIYL